MAVNPYNPAKPVDFPIRPLTKGMMPNISMVNIPLGGLLDSEGYHILPQGLQRIEKISAFTQSIGIATNDAPIRDLIFFKPTNKDVELLIVGQKYLYRYVNGTVETVYWTYSTGTVSNIGKTVTGVNTEWLDDKTVRPQDILVFDPDGSPEAIEISSINSNTQITLSTLPSQNYPAGTDYEIRHIFNVSSPYLFDWTLAPGKVIFTDSSHPLCAYDGETLSLLSTNVKSLVAHSVTFAFDRLWIGGVLDSTTDYDYIYRIRWSTTTDIGQFIGAPDIQWLDIPYGAGRLLKILPLGPLLVAYFQDKIFLGRRTNIAGDALPFSFTESLDTGGVGLVGQRAIADWMDTHFFMSYDNIYTLTPRGGIQAIGTSVINQIISRTSGTTTGSVLVAIIDIATIHGGAPSDVTPSGDTLGGAPSSETTFDSTIGGLASNPGYTYIDQQLINIIDIAITYGGAGAGETTFYGSLGGADADVDTFIDTLGGLSADPGQTYVPVTSGSNVMSITKAYLDNLHNRIIFAVAVDGSSTINEFYSYYLKTKAWSTEGRGYQALATGTIASETDYKLLIGDSNTVKYYTDESDSIRAIITTPDLDYNRPDTNKTHTRLSLKLVDPATTTLVFTVSGSTDRGETWKTLGQLTIPSGKTESYVNFRITGSIVRFRLITETDTEQFTVQEIVVRVYGRGIESHIRTS